MQTPPCYSNMRMLLLRESSLAFHLSTALTFQKTLNDVNCLLRLWELRLSAMPGPPPPPRGRFLLIGLTRPLWRLLRSGWRSGRFVATTTDQGIPGQGPVIPRQTNNRPGKQLDKVLFTYSCATLLAEGERRVRWAVRFYQAEITVHSSSFLFDLSERVEQIPNTLHEALLSDEDAYLVAGDLFAFNGIDWDICVRHAHDLLQYVRLILAMPLLR